MPSFKILILSAASAALIAGCATSTPYQPASAPGAYDGFSQTMIENDRARITFGGNSLTSRETVENSLLYRAAEMSLERGFDYFSLMQRDTEENTRVRVSPGLSSSLYDPYFGYSFYRPGFGWSRSYAYSRFGGFRRGRGFGYSGFHSRFDDPFFNDYDVREITKYRATSEVRFGKGPTPNLDNAFDAREVLRNLSEVIDFPQENS